MDTKLTLKLKNSIIENAKKYAKKHQISLSKMVENYLNAVTGNSKKNIEVTPFVESLTGVINLENKDYKKDYSNYLSEKYK